MLRYAVVRLAVAKPKLKNGDPVYKRFVKINTQIPPDVVDEYWQVFDDTVKASMKSGKSTYKIDLQVPVSAFLNYQAFQWEESKWNKNLVEENKIKKILEAWNGLPANEQAVFGLEKSDAWDDFLIQKPTGKKKAKKAVKKVEKVEKKVVKKAKKKVTKKTEKVEEPIVLEEKVEKVEANKTETTRKQAEKPASQKKIETVEKQAKKQTSKITGFHIYQAECQRDSPYMSQEDIESTWTYMTDTAVQLYEEEAIAASN